MAQIKHVINSMPDNTEIEHRNRALIAFVLLTGARDSAVASIKLKYVDLVVDCVYQDAREVKTKYSKTFNTFFFPVGDVIVKWLADGRTMKLMEDFSFTDAKGTTWLAPAPRIVQVEGKREVVRNVDFYHFYL